MSGKYDDILCFTHPTSKKHPRMSLHDRAAQFSPFAALSGHHAVIAEAERQTEQQRELDEYELVAINRKLCFLSEHLYARPSVQLCYFQEDKKKPGGNYISMTGTVKKMDFLHGTLIMDSGTIIALENIWSIESEFFSSLDE